MYAATLAPGVTLWDAGEFLSAIHSVGIPHPPGTPLYVVIGSAWSTLLGSALGFTRAVNLLSALATAGGCALLAACVSRWTSSRGAGVAAGIAAGTMLSVWSNANETEVYALSLLCALVALALGDRAGTSGRWRDAALAVYVLALAVPLHLSALVIAPGVVLFAAMSTDGRILWPKLTLLTGAVLLAMALGTTAPWLGVVALLLMGVGAGLGREVPRRWRVGRAAALGALLFIAASAVFVMLFRARQDPFVNQGNPNTFDGLLAVIGREQYDVSGVWPRRAPLWLQVGNLIQYADWQVAFGLDDWVGASLRRTPITIVFVALAFFGAAWHRARDARSFRAMAAAVLSASLGTILVLNLRAGPSFGVGVLPAGAGHEARERDYFFALAFALCAAWAGIGAMRVGLWAARRWRAPAAASVVALAIAGAPIALNWRAADRGRDGSPTLAHRLAASLLDAAPERGVLLVAGDNDTYPLWYLQEVEGRRRDVAIVTIPLLPAEWYRDELRRRHRLLADAVAWRGVEATIDSVAERARALRRPVAVAASVSARQRDALGGAWLAQGLLYLPLERGASSPVGAVRVTARGDSLLVGGSEQRLFVDTVAAARVGAPRRRVRDGNPTRAYVVVLLSCPEQILRAVRGHGGSVDPRCNLR